MLLLCFRNILCLLIQHCMVHSPTIYTLLQCMDLINRESPGHTVYDGQALDVRQAAIIIRSKLSGSIHLCHYNYGTNIQQWTIKVLALVYAYYAQSLHGLLMRGTDENMVILKITLFHKIEWNAIKFSWGTKFCVFRGQNSAKYAPYLPCKDW